MFEENLEPEKPEVPPTGEVPPVETPPAEILPEGGATDQEKDDLKKQIAERDELLKKNEKELKQQRYLLGKHDKLFNKLKEQGVEIPEDEPAVLSEDKIGEIVEERIKPIVEGFKTTLGEIARSVKPNANPGGGSGQKPPIKPKEPELSPFIKDQVKRLGLEWTGQGRIYKSKKTGRIYDYDENPQEVE